MCENALRSWSANEKPPLASSRVAFSSRKRKQIRNTCFSLSLSLSTFFFPFALCVFFFIIVVCSFSFRIHFVAFEVFFGSLTIFLGSSNNLCGQEALPFVHIALCDGKSENQGARDMRTNKSRKKSEFAPKNQVFIELRVE